MQSDEDENAKKNISVRASKNSVDEFDRTIKKAQIEGKIPMNVSRGKVIRGLMSLAAEDTELVAEAVEKDESE